MIVECCLTDRAKADLHGQAKFLKDTYVSRGEFHPDAAAFFDAALRWLVAVTSPWAQARQIAIILVRQQVAFRLVVRRDDTEGEQWPRPMINKFQRLARLWQQQRMLKRNPPRRPSQELSVSA
jgi:hypothetical protein